jgi:hypothetical protein
MDVPHRRNLVTRNLGDTPLQINDSYKYGRLRYAGKERKNDGTTPLLPPGIEQLHSEIVHIADIPRDQRQFVYKRSCGEKCIDDRP